MMLKTHKSLRLIFLMLLLYIKRHGTLATYLLLAILLAMFLQYKFNFFQFKTTALSEGLVGTYQEHDLPLEVTRLLSTSLVEPDTAGRIQPKLIESWEVNPEATVYKFKIRENAVWLDGSKIKSSELEFSIPNTEVSFPDERIIEFKLKESYSAFPSLLAKPVFKKGSLLGTGPYKITKIEKSQIFITKIVLDPIDPNMPKLVVRFYPNEKTALTGFELGEVQSLLGLGSNIDSPLVKTQSKVDYTKVVTVFYNTKDDVLSNRSLRQALSFSAPLIENEVEANNPYPPSSWAFENLKDYLAKPEEAKEALSRAKNNSSQELLGREIVLTTTLQLEGVGKKVIASWREAGINAILRVESGVPQKFQALLITQSIPADPDQYFLWHESQKEKNLSKFEQKRVDKDLEDGRKLIKEEERKEKYIDFQKVLLEDSPATFLYFPKYNIVYLNKAEEKLNRVLPLQFPALIR